MRRWLPAPGLSVAVALVWLLLADSVAPVHLLTAALLGVLLPLPAQRLRGEDLPRMKRPLLMLRLVGRVMIDIVVANLQVAVRILGPQSRLRPGFVWIPLELHDPHAVSALAGIITMTPGTLSSDLSPDRRFLLVHCFHVDDAAATIRDIKQRYEIPLREIFE